MGTSATLEVPPLLLDQAARQRFERHSDSPVARTPPAKFQPNRHIEADDQSAVLLLPIDALPGPLPLPAAQAPSR